MGTVRNAKLSTMKLDQTHALAVLSDLSVTGRPPEQI